MGLPGKLRNCYVGANTLTLVIPLLPAGGRKNGYLPSPHRTLSQSAAYLNLELTDSSLS